jgi:hypothetical protein
VTSWAVPFVESELRLKLLSAEDGDYSAEKHRLADLSRDSSSELEAINPKLVPEKSVSNKKTATT